MARFMGWRSVVGSVVIVTASGAADGSTLHAHDRIRSAPRVPSLVGLPATRADTGQRDDSAAVATAVGQFHQALARGDSATALSLLAGDATILESGGSESVAEYRAHHLPADIAFARAVRETRSPMQITVRGDAAWAVSTSSARGTFRGRPVNTAGAELMVLTRSPDGWRIAAIHWSSRRRGA